MVAETPGGYPGGSSAVRPTLALRNLLRLARLAGFTPEAFAAGHKDQLGFIQCLIRWIVLMCSRRAGKTAGIAGRYGTRSMAKPGGNRIYLALTAGQAREIMWEPLWLPMCEKWKLPVRHNETRMVTKFANGSKVRFGGTDDIEAIKHELGAGLDEAAVDECQDQPERVLRPLLTRILPHALTDRRGTLIASGVVPEVDAGYYMELWKDSDWAKFNWSQMENPHMQDPMGELMEYLAKAPGLTINSPIIQRERFGKFVYDAEETAYRYDPSLNGYQPEAPDWLAEAFAGNFPEAVTSRPGKLSWKYIRPTRKPDDGGARFGIMAAKPRPGINRFSAAIDPGASDRFSLEVLGYGTQTQEIQHVFEWSTPRNARCTWNDVASVGALVEWAYSPDEWRYDAGGSQNELDTFQVDYGIPVIEAAKKSDMKGQIRRFNNELTKGWLLVMIGSALEEDLKKARRDKNTPAGAPWRWASQWHPDPSETSRYALQGYYNLFEPAETPQSEGERIAQQQRFPRSDDDVSMGAIWEEDDS